MSENQRLLPTWILYVSAIFALLEIAVSISICIAPESVAENVDIAAKGVLYLVYIWAARQFALGFIFAYATYKRSASMLTLCYMFFLVMMVGDLAIGILQKENALVIVAAMMAVISSAMIYAINKKSQ